MLKFRLPYTPGTTRYLDGTVMLPVWGGRTTSETRLVVVRPSASDFAMRDYDNGWFSDAMFYHNTVRRVGLYEHCVAGGAVPGMDRCYDCAAEVAVATRYLAHPLWGVGHEPTPEEVAELVRLVGARIGVTRKGLCVF